eukprot:Hpha_TRINITY_DN20210_c0_g1::TRINITY_DN20210_c0_g1_i1::g.168276::m.168276
MGVCVVPVIGLCVLSSPSLPPLQPSAAPSLRPSIPPTASLPTVPPTKRPTAAPTIPPTFRPTPPPTGSPTASPTASPTGSPTIAPSTSPTVPTPTVTQTMTWWWRTERASDPAKGVFVAAHEYIESDKLIEAAASDVGGCANVTAAEQDAENTHGSVKVSRYLFDTADGCNMPRDPDEDAGDSPIARVEGRIATDCRQITPGTWSDIALAFQVAFSDVESVRLEASGGGRELVFAIRSSAVDSSGELMWLLQERQKSTPYKAVSGSCSSAGAVNIRADGPATRAIVQLTTEPGVDAASYVALYRPDIVTGVSTSLSVPRGQIVRVRAASSR